MMSLAFTELMILDDFSLKERQRQRIPDRTSNYSTDCLCLLSNQKTTKIPNLCCNLL